jgi:hypothetical protein
MASIRKICKHVVSVILDGDLNKLGAVLSRPLIAPLKLVYSLARKYRKWIAVTAISIVTYVVISDLEYKQAEYDINAKWDAVEAEIPELDECFSTSSLSLEQCNNDIYSKSISALYGRSNELESYKWSFLPYRYYKRTMSDERL